jgi:predicted dehydrogenase
MGMRADVRNVRCGLVGFGFIGPHHAEAMRRLGFVDVVAVCSDEPGTTRQKAAALRIPKFYDRYEELIADPEIDVVDIVTPTHLHDAVAMAALARRKHVIVDKPLALSTAQAKQLVESAREAGVVNAVTFNYRYHPLVQQARVMVSRGELGDIHLVHGRYLQEWLLYDTDFNWRLEPEKSGPAGMVADAGSHWFDLVEHVTGLRIAAVLPELKTTIPVRKKPLGAAPGAFLEAAGGPAEDYQVKVPDLGMALLRFDNGASGCFSTSSLCAGYKNDLRFEIHGSRGSLLWLQEEPNRLWIGKRGEPDRVITKDPSLLDPSVRHYAALPGGHGEAWPDAFKNIMANIFGFIVSGADPGTADGLLFPTFEDGYRAAAIAEAMGKGSAAGGVWTAVESCGARV